MDTHTEKSKERSTGDLLVGADDVRVIVVGTSGSGKSTLANQLAQRLGCAHVELDALHWGPNWTPYEDFKPRVIVAIADDSWIADGNYGGVRTTLFSRATTVIWLDYPFHTVFGRALRRSVWRGWSREVLWNGNRESFLRSFFSRKSILWWVITTFRRHRREFSALRASNKFPHLRWIHLRHPSEADHLLKRIRVDAVDKAGPSSDSSRPLGETRHHDARSHFEANEKWQV